MMPEELTRGVPYDAAEFAWARRRPAPHRTPLPSVGDEVLYRHDAWAEPVRAEVLSVQPLDDHDDPHLWTVQVDPLSGQPILLEGKPLFVATDDPWPKLTLNVPGIGRVVTREARLRGAPGWLPLDWRERTRPSPTFHIPVPHDTSPVRDPINLDVLRNLGER